VHREKEGALRLEYLQKYQREDKEAQRYLGENLDPLH